MTIQELRAKRAKLITDARSITDAVIAEERAAMTAEEEQRFDALMAESDQVKATIERAERAEADTRSLEQTVAASATRQPTTALPTGRAFLATPEYRAAFGEWLRYGEGVGPEVRALLDRPEARAQGTGTTAGGYTIPTELSSTLLDTSLRNVNVMRQLATVITASNNTNVATTSAHGSAAWTSESVAYNESDETFGQVTFAAYKATRIVKVNKELLSDSAFDIEAYLNDEFSMSLGVLEEAAYVNGDGSSKPTGVVGGSTLGKSFTSQTAVTADELVELFHSLGRRYRINATWLASDAFIMGVRKLVTGVSGDKTYLWQPGLVAGQPDTLLGRPVVTSDNVPAPTTGNKSVLFGDFRRYWVVQRQGVAFARLNELYAANGQVGFLCDLRVDGKLTDTAAVKHGIQA